MEFLNTPDTTAEFTKEDIESCKLWSALAYFGITFWLPLVVKPESKFGKYHANQSLLLLIVGAILGVASGVIGAILGIIPILGWILAAVIGLAINLVTLGFFLFGLINTLNGKAKELPFIGKIRLLK